MWRNFFLGGVSFAALYAPEGGGGAPDPAAPPPASPPAPGAPPAPAPGATPPAPAPGADTLAGGGGAPPPAAPATWPEKWRDLLAGGDAKAAGDLAKYTDPAALYKSLRSLQADVSSGKLKAAPTPLPENATPEQKAEWRKANGLHEKAETYVEKLALPDGVVIGEADKPLVGDFAQMAHDRGWSQAQFNEAVSWFYEAQEASQAARAEADGGHKTSAAAELAAEWGAADYKVNMNAMGSLLATMPEELRATVLTARTPDGQMLGNSAGWIRWAAAQGRELNPAATIVPAGTANAGKTIADEVASIEKSMYDDRGQPNPAYWHDNAKQARYRELLEAQQKMSTRGQAV